MESSTPGLTSFPLEKFSHSSSAPTSPSHQWNHESKRDGLYLVFQKMRLQSNSIEPVQERFVMSITSGGNVLVWFLKQPNFSSLRPLTCFDK